MLRGQLLRLLTVQLRLQQVNQFPVRRLRGQGLLAFSNGDERIERRQSISHGDIELYLRYL
jgi:hypothetical protein